jgi:hypothetical protein
MGSLSMQQSRGLAGGWAGSARSILAPWTAASDIKQAKEGRKAIQAQANLQAERTKTLEAQAGLVRAHGAETEAEFIRINKWNAELQRRREAVGKEMAIVRASATKAEAIRSRLAGNIEAYGLEHKLGAELDGLVEALIAGTSSVAAIDVETADMDRLGAMKVELGTAKWVVKEGLNRLKDLNIKVNMAIRLQQRDEDLAEAAKREEADRLYAAAQDALDAEERQEFLIASKIKRADLAEWIKVRKATKDERAALARDLARLSAARAAMAALD